MNEGRLCWVPVPTSLSSSNATARNANLSSEICSTRKGMVSS